METEAELASQYRPFAVNRLHTERGDTGTLMIFTGIVGTGGVVIAGVSYIADRYLSHLEGLVPQVLDGISKAGIGVGVAVATVGFGISGACIVALRENIKDSLVEGRKLDAWTRISRRK